MNPTITRKFALEFQWPTQEPFLFCVHHLDLYPKPASGSFGPEKGLLAGRPLGQDFTAKDGFRMYHGETVPGFPVHPHRGFETLTVTRRGLVDHADSMGAAGRYGGGDVQWMTAGQGVQHSEMFPLLRSDGDNTMELFQIWLNLPKRSKLTAPDFKMFWHERLPVVEQAGARVTLIAGSFGAKHALEPPKASWAHSPESETAVWLIRLEPGHPFELPSGSQGLGRSLYFYEGDELLIGDERVPSRTGMFVDPTAKLTLRAEGAKPAEILLLQSRPIGEPVAQYGPFVMNTQAEIRQTFADYERTRFGGWPWPKHDMVHGPGVERFAKYGDGRVEKP